MTTFPSDSGNVPGGQPAASGLMRVDIVGDLGGSSPGMNLVKSLPKTVEVGLDRGHKFMITVRLNPDSWQSEPRLIVVSSRI